MRKIVTGLCWKLRHTQYIVIELWLGAAVRVYIVCSLLSKFLFSGDPLFLGHSPSPVFTAVIGEDPCSLWTQ